MAKSIRDTTKGRGRPKTTGRGVAVMLRMHPPTLTELDKWIAAQSTPLSRPDAIRLAVDVWLKGMRCVPAHGAPESSNGHTEALSTTPRGKTRAAEVVDKALAKIDAPPEEKERRKRRLLKGPKSGR
jgi:hypothetical protein